MNNIRVADPDSFFASANYQDFNIPEDCSPSSAFASG
jgi:hypothetical protein